MRAHRTASRRGLQSIGGQRARPETEAPRPLQLGFPEPPSGTCNAQAAELWLAVHLPDLKRWIRASCPAQPPSVAGDLPVPDSADAALRALAVHAGRFTPRVCLEPPDALLLEVKGSVHLFGDVPGLLREVRAEHARLGFTCRLALAPTALAALAAARTGREWAITDATRLIGSLAQLPLASLRCPPETLARLASMGVRSVGQVLRLPRAGLARRFGPQLPLLLDRLTGRSPDLRVRFAPPERFHSRRDLGYEVENQQHLLACLAPQLQELGRFLTSRQCGVRRLECRLRHRHVPPSRCVLRLAEATADIARITELLGERLQQLELPEPVRACALRSGGLEPLRAGSGALWQPGEHGGRSGAAGAQLIERLQARLGAQAVHGLALAASHRPESAWRSIEPAATGEACAELPTLLPRPTWLLAAPELLPERAGVPWRGNAPLRLLGDPERIETGWWDGGEIARDYYPAVDAAGTRLWLFRERAAPHRWFLHGLYA